MPPVKLVETAPDGSLTATIIGDVDVIDVERVNEHIWAYDSTAAASASTRTTVTTDNQYAQGVKAFLSITQKSSTATDELIVQVEELDQGNRTLVVAEFTPIVSSDVTVTQDYVFEFSPRPSAAATGRAPNISEGSFTAGSSSAVAVAATRERRELTIFNPSDTEDVWLSRGGTAAASSGIWLPAGSSWTEENFRGQINAIRGGSSNVTCSYSQVKGPARYEHIPGLIGRSLRVKVLHNPSPAASAWDYTLDCLLVKV